MSSDNIIKCDGIVNEGIHKIAFLKIVAESVRYSMLPVTLYWWGEVLIRGRLAGLSLIILVLCKGAGCSVANLPENFQRCCNI